MRTARIPTKTLNIADITNTTNTEGVLIAAMFAAQGYIVVAPNYAGYDISTLGYHPFLNAEQQSGEMIDILTAARTALPKTLSSATSDSGKLFVTGYSEGGHVAMATQRALEASGAVVTGAAPMSGPYALEAFGDAIFFGNVDIGSTEFSPLLTTSYQKAYGNIYTTPSDVYSATYANGIETLLPSATPIDTIFSTGLLPETAEFDSTTPVVTVPGNPALSAELTALLSVPGSANYPLSLVTPQTPLFAAGFGSPYLINNSYRVTYALDAASNPDGAVPASTAAARSCRSRRPRRRRRCAWPSTRTICATAAGRRIPHLAVRRRRGSHGVLSVNTEDHGGLLGSAGAGRPHHRARRGTPLLPVRSQPYKPASRSLKRRNWPSTNRRPAAACRRRRRRQLIVEDYHASVAPFCTVAARAFFSEF